jgi:hypothetical protein
VNEAASAFDSAEPGEDPPLRATVFMSDPSAEAEDVARLLRGAGYAVMDVPMSMLVARVAVQKPAVIVIDADGAGATDAVAAIRALEGGDAIEVLLLGHEAPGDGPKTSASATPVGGFFRRPVDPTAVVGRIEALTGGSRVRASRPPTTDSGAPAPASIAPAAAVPASVAPPASVAAPSSRSPASPSGGGRRAPDRSSPIPPAPLSARPAISIQGTLSAELAALLVDAEQRIGAQAMHEAVPPTPEEELENVLPAELLASLDEPIEEDEDDSAVDGGLSRLSPSSARGGTRAPGQTNAGHVLTPAVSEVGPYTVAGSAFTSSTSAWSRPEMEDSSRAVGPKALTPLESREVHGPHSLGVAPTLSAPALAALSSNLSPEATPIPRDTGVKAVRAEGGPATVLNPGDPPRLLASAVASRASGTLSFEAPEALRRVVLRDGDLVTAASSADDETLLAFLTSRGDLRREQVKDLVGKVAPFGRHAGAALVAHGLLRQDQLWTALRAHAEWVVGRTLNVARGTARIEAEAPGRLRQEPSVFGGSSGAEVLVEVARRVIAPDEALRRLGGRAARVTEGAAVALLAECALAAEERAIVDEAPGLTLGEILGDSASPGIAPMLYMLSLLGICDVTAAIAPSSRAESSALQGTHDDDVIALDLTAIRERIRARHDLVCEGDYFTLLGVSRDATGYEVRRAFLELRHAFEPSRILTPEVKDLEDDVRTIISVLDEAYEILKDSARRERYRRALGEGP